MKITICASLDFTNEIKDVYDKLIKQGHEASIPKTSEAILSGEISLEQIKKEKETGEISNRAIRENSIMRHFKKVEEADAILVLNLEKKGIQGYIGGNTFLEIGLAYFLNKKIFLLNDIPEMPYTDEIRGMQPTILNGDLSGIK